MKITLVHTDVICENCARDEKPRYDIEMYFDLSTRKLRCILCIECIFKVIKGLTPMSARRNLEHEGKDCDDSCRH
jgi:hypothetical protein